MAKFSSCVVILLLLVNSVLAQTITMSEKLDDEKIERFGEDARQMVSFLEFLLNSLGDPETSRAQKNTIIDETYAKVFRDSKVQVEDDLLPNREVVTMKDVQAYLKDITFFYKKGANFSLQVNTVDYFINQNGKHSYKLAMDRTIRGLNVDNDSVIITGPRYMEVVVDVLNEDIKIVSFYSSLIKEENAMTKWWNDLPDALKSVTASQIYFNDSLKLDDLLKLKPDLLIGDSLETDSGSVLVRNEKIFQSIRNVYVITELNCEGMEDLTDITGLTNLKNLRRLDLSNTAVTDVSPLQALNNLEELDISNTDLGNPDPLRNLEILKTLDISNTKIVNAYFLKNLKALRKVNISNTAIKDSRFFSTLENLQELDLSNTGVVEINGLVELSELRSLNIDRTKVKNVEPLAKLPKLETLFANYTPISSIAAFKDSESIEKIYCDSTGIGRESAAELARHKPGLLVVFESEMLLTWWKSLDVHWQSVFKNIKLETKLPSKEALQELILMNELDLNGRREIGQISSLSVFYNLKSLDLSNTGTENIAVLSQMNSLENLYLSSNPISNIDALSELRNLKVLDLSMTEITSIDPLMQLEELRWLNISGSDVAEIGDLTSLKSLEIIYCEKILLPPYRISGITKVHPNVLFVYNSEYLNNWWSELTKDWQEVFAKHTTISAKPKPEELHSVIALDSIHFVGNRSMTSLEPLSQLTRLRYLYFSNTGISSLDPLAFMGQLKHLKVPENPISDLSPVKDLITLEELDISNTPVSDLRYLEFFINLKRFNCAGTQTRNLKYLRGLNKLEHIEIQNTPVSNLSSLPPDAPLQILTCYNTKLNERKLNAFKEKFPDCQVIFY